MTRARYRKREDEIATREGNTRYAAVDYLVSNRADGSDEYAVSREKFESMYERADEPQEGVDR